MEKATKKIIKSIKPGTHFDIHFVVKKLFQEYTNEYYRLIRDHSTINQAVLVKRLGKTIVDHCSDCTFIGQATSYNIHGNETVVRLFRKNK